MLLSTITFVEFNHEKVHPYTDFLVKVQVHSFPTHE